MVAWQPSVLLPAVGPFDGLTRPRSNRLPSQILSSGATYTSSQTRTAPVKRQVLSTLAAILADNTTTAAVFVWAYRLPNITVDVSGTVGDASGNGGAGGGGAGSGGAADDLSAQNGGDGGNGSNGLAGGVGGSPPVPTIGAGFGSGDSSGFGDWGTGGNGGAGGNSNGDLSIGGGGGTGNIGYSGGGGGGACGVTAVTPAYGGGGGGGGGLIAIVADIIDGAGTLTANGAAGGSVAGGDPHGGGGGGGGGVIAVYAMRYTGQLTVAVSAGAGGAGGGGGFGGADGQAGTDGEAKIFEILSDGTIGPERSFGDSWDNIPVSPGVADGPTIVGVSPQSPTSYVYTLQAPAAYPAYGASWDGYAEGNVTPPTDQRATNVGLNGQFGTQNVSDGDTLYAMMRAFNEPHSKSTDGTIASFSIPYVAEPSPPTIDGVTGDSAGNYFVTFRTPASKPLGATAWDIYADDNNPPTTLIQSDAADDTPYNSGSFDCGTPIYAKMVARAASNSATSTVTTQPKPIGDPDAPTFTSQNFDTGDQWSSLTWRTPVSFPSGADDARLYADTSDPPTTEIFESNQLNTNYNTGSVTSGQTGYARWRVTGSSGTLVRFGGTASHFVAIDAPSPPSVQSVNDVGGGDFTVTWGTPSALPNGATSFDLYSDTNTDPPTTVLQANASTSTNYDSAAAATGNNITGMMRALGGTTSTDSSVTTQPV